MRRPSVRTPRESSIAVSGESAAPAVRHIASSLVRQVLSTPRFWELPYYHYGFHYVIAALSLLAGALTGHRRWTQAWRTPEPRKSYDVVLVGAGGHGLATAYYLAKKHGIRNIAILEKGFSIGSHGISGAAMAPGPLKELVPDFLEKGAPLEGEVKKESVYLLTKTGKIKSPMCCGQDMSCSIS